MIISQAQLTIGPNQVSIVQDDQGRIYCFKHDRTHCQWEYFPDLDSATDFIFSGMPTWQYTLTEKPGTLDS